MANATILIVEDDKDIMTVNADHLRDENYDIIETDTIQKAYDAVMDFNPDIIVLDICLPDGSGIEFCKEIRSITSVPIIFLTALDEDEDKIKGLLSGGDDYMTKPYNLNELTVRIYSLLRRVQLEDKKIYEYSPIKIDTVTQKAYLHSQDVVLTPREYQILLLLIKNRGRTVSAKYIYETLWGDNPYDGVRTVNVHISSIRKKLKMDYDTSVQIQTRRNSGFCFRHLREDA